MKLVPIATIIALAISSAASLPTRAEDPPLTAQRKKQKADEDLFTRIAREFDADRARDRTLKQQDPPQLPDRALPWDARSSGGFDPMPKMRTQAQLEAELKRLRAKYTPFMRDLAPPLRSQRIRMDLERFDWRLETAEDRRDFSHTLDGDGRWEQVTIPHYRGPLGKAVAWYRTEFTLDKRMLARDALYVRFKGVDYTADVFVNGHYLGSHEGLFAPFEFEFKWHARPGKNVLLVKVSNDAVQMGNPIFPGRERLFGDKFFAAVGPGWDEPGLGWHHCNPGFGIWQDVFVEARGEVFIHDVFVRPLPHKNQAEVWVELWNTRPLQRDVSLTYSLYGQNFQATLAENQKAAVHGGLGPGMNYGKFTIPISDAELRWWDTQTPWLYQIQLTLHHKGRAADAFKRQFGMRTFTQSRTSVPKGRLYLNGKEIRLRGANTMGNLMQCVIRRDWNQLRDDILIAKIAHLNFWRLTQSPVQDEVYDYCDRLGIMTQTDLPTFDVIRRNQFVEGVRQVREMEHLVRSHPCNVLISYINEPFQSQPHRCLNPAELRMFFESADRMVHLNNPDRIIKHVDGDYLNICTEWMDHHCYTGWYHDHGIQFGKLHKGRWIPSRPDWMHACGEFGAEGLDDVELMRRRYPAKWLPQTPEQEKRWDPGRVPFVQTGSKHYQWFDTQNTLEDWVKASHEHQAWATRLMTTAFRRDANMNSFAVHLLIDAWPAGWLKTLVNTERRAKPAYFTYREALTPLMADLRSDRSAFFSGEPIKIEAWICNDTHETHSGAKLSGAKLRYQVEVDGRVVKTGSAPAKILACAPQFQGFLNFTAPPTPKRGVMTVRLGLVGNDGRALHDTELSLDLFPAPAGPPCGRVRIVGKRDGRAARLADRVGVPEKVFEGGFGPSDVILIDDYQAFKKVEKEITAAVKAGARAVFLQFRRGGRFNIAADTLKVTDAMGLHFVSRKTGHPLVAGFKPNDLKFWYDARCDYVTYIVLRQFDAPDDWKPVLLSHQKRVAAEKPDGKGSWIVCQLSLVDRLDGNPVAEIFARRLLMKQPCGNRPATAGIL